jgi:hypothetical protein
MAVARIGPLTGILEALAAAVGAGILLGGFTIGLCRMIAGRPRRTLEMHVLTDGYFGGAAAVIVVLLDLVVRYG